MANLNDRADENIQRCASSVNRYMLLSVSNLDHGKWTKTSKIYIEKAIEELIHLQLESVQRELDFSNVTSTTTHPQQKQTNLWDKSPQVQFGNYRRLPLSSSPIPKLDSSPSLVLSKPKYFSQKKSNVNYGNVDENSDTSLNTSPSVPLTPSPTISSIASPSPSPSPSPSSSPSSSRSRSPSRSPSSSPSSSRSRSPSRSPSSSPSSSPSGFVSIPLSKLPSHNNDSIIDLTVSSQSSRRDSGQHSTVGNTSEQSSPPLSIDLTESYKDGYQNLPLIAKSNFARYNLNLLDGGQSEPPLKMDLESTNVIHQQREENELPKSILKNKRKFQPHKSYGPYDRSSVLSFPFPKMNNSQPGNPSTNVAELQRSPITAQSGEITTKPSDNATNTSAALPSRNKTSFVAPKRKTSGTVHQKTSRRTPNILTRRVITQTPISKLSSYRSLPSTQHAGGAAGGSGRDIGINLGGGAVNLTIYAKDPALFWEDDSQLRYSRENAQRWLYTKPNIKMPLDWLVVLTEPVSNHWSWIADYYKVPKEILTSGGISNQSKMVVLWNWLVKTKGLVIKRLDFTKMLQLVPADFSVVTSIMKKLFEYIVTLP